MCGVVGMVGSSPVNVRIYDALQVLQHRGQDAAGIVTVDADDNFHQRKANGMVSEVFAQRHMLRLVGNIGIGHNRYPTAGSSSAAEAQPFYVNSPYGIALAHNGNLINAADLKARCTAERRHVNTQSDSEILLNILAWQLAKNAPRDGLPAAAEVFAAIRGVMAEIRGGYAVVGLILGVGLIAFRDPLGIRPLCLGRRRDRDGHVEYMVASESVALAVNRFTLVRDVAPGEALLITSDGRLQAAACAPQRRLQPCIFEYVYFARPDSVMNGVSVYAARVHMGERLAAKIKRDYPQLQIDAVIPIPDTSIDIAVQIARSLRIPYRQGFVKNRYIGRTFIMPGQQRRSRSVRRKLNPIPAEFRGKKVLLVDDSIVRGTTSLQIVEMAREAGAAAVYFASAAPEIRYPNIYGIDMPSARELIAHDRAPAEIAAAIRVDALIYQSLSDLEASVREENPELRDFEVSIFTGEYPVPPSPGYFDRLARLRADDGKAARLWQDAADEDLELYNLSRC